MEHKSSHPFAFSHFKSQAAFNFSPIYGFIWPMRVPHPTVPSQPRGHRTSIDMCMGSYRDGVVPVCCHCPRPPLVEGWINHRHRQRYNQCRECRASPICIAVDWIGLAGTGCIPGWIDSYASIKTSWRCYWRTLCTRVLIASQRNPKWCKSATPPFLILRFAS